MDTNRPVLRSRAWLIAAGVLAVLLLLLALAGFDQPEAARVAIGLTLTIAIGVVMWAVRAYRRQRRRHEDELTAWAGELAAQAERLRIARDLHDLASHGLGLITVRAASTRNLPGTGGAQERVRALADIEVAARAATTELRRMLDVLRSPGDEAPLRPADTLADLPRIVTDSGASGLRTSLDVARPEEVSAGAQMAICVVVREGLANAVRHAGPTDVRVQVRRCGDDVLVTVDDDGPVDGWRADTGAGQGLNGLRERIGALGGTVRSGPRGDGFRLSATIPDRTAIPPGPAP